MKKEKIIYSSDVFYFFEQLLNYYKFFSLTYTTKKVYLLNFCQLVYNPNNGKIFSIFNFMENGSVSVWATALIAQALKNFNIFNQSPILLIIQKPFNPLS